MKDKDRILKFIINIINTLLRKMNNKYKLYRMEKNLTESMYYLGYSLIMRMTNNDKIYSLLVQVSPTSYLLTV